MSPSHEYYLAKAFYTSPTDLSARISELQPLANKTIALFGLGCLGASSAMEFARAGVGRIRMVDHDTVDPATTVRWPIGFAVAGQKKVHVLREFIRQNYPYTETEPFEFRVGAVRYPSSSRRSDQSLIQEITNAVDLIFDATTEEGVQHFLTDYAWDHGIPYIGLSGTLGGWGGKVFRIRRRSGVGCWFCYRRRCDDHSICEPPFAPEEQGTVQPTGCADPTFTGASFDMLQIALMGVRMAVSTLCEDTPQSYPPASWDVVHIRLRGDDGALVTPRYDTYNISPDPSCPHCGHAG